MVDRDSEAKWIGYKGYSVSDKRSSISRLAEAQRDPDDPWVIDSKINCLTLFELGAKNVGEENIAREDCLKTVGLARNKHCIHVWPNGIKQCCLCETVVENPRTFKLLEDEGLI